MTELLMWAASEAEHQGRTSHPTPGSVTRAWEHLSPSNLREGLNEKLRVDTHWP